MPKDRAIANVAMIAVFFQIFVCLHCQYPAKKKSPKPSPLKAIAVAVESEFEPL